MITSRIEVEIEGKIVHVLAREHNITRTMIKYILTPLQNTIDIPLVHIVLAENVQNTKYA